MEPTRSSSSFSSKELFYSFVSRSKKMITCYPTFWMGFKPFEKRDNVVVVHTCANIIIVRRRVDSWFIHGAAGEAWWIGSSSSSREGPCQTLIECDLSTRLVKAKSKAPRRRRRAMSCSFLCVTVAVTVVRFKFEPEKSIKTQGANQGHPTSTFISIKVDQLQQQKQSTPHPLSPWLISTSDNAHERTNQQQRKKSFVDRKRRRPAAVFDLCQTLTQSVA